MFSEFCTFIENIYGGKHWLTTDELGLTVLYIENGCDRFRVHLADKARFRKYDLYHRNYGKRLDGTWPYHRQFSSIDLGYIIYAAYTHDFNKEVGIFNSNEDYRKLLQDFWRSCKK